MFQAVCVNFLAVTFAIEASLIVHVAVEVKVLDWSKSK